MLDGGEVAINQSSKRRRYAARLYSGVDMQVKKTYIEGKMKRTFATIAIFFTPTTFATDLYCTGTAWPSIGQSFDDSRIVSLLNDGAQMTASTFTGQATGDLVKGTQLYTGFLHSNSIRYWINLDRYSGQFSLMLTREDGSPLRAEFNGTCKQRSPQF